MIPIIKIPPEKIKTVIDYSFTILFVTILIPVFLFLALTIKISGKGPVIYSQKRIGKSGNSFTLYKFRSMYHGTEEGADLISDRNDKRITPVGQFMRRYKLDEIPNFFNVIKGDMSLVGPRPEQEYYIEKIILKAPHYKQLHSIKPGITSWGQVKYGYASNVDEMIKRLDYDLYYFENRSLLFDLKIILYTIGIVIKGKGI